MAYQPYCCNLLLSGLQIDHLSLEQRATNEKMQTTLRNEQDEIIRMLHIEVDCIDRRINHPSSRMSNIHPFGASNDAHVEQHSRPGRGAKCRLHLGRGRCTPTMTHAESSTIALARRPKDHEVRSFRSW